MSRVDAESRIFADIYPSLRRFAAVVAPVECDPDDLVQEAVVRTLKRHHLDHLAQPGAYLRRTILNLASNERRRFAIRRRAMTRNGIDSDTQVDAYPSDLTDLLELPPVERAVLYLSEVEGYRFADIADMLDCTEVAARKRAMRARRRLYAVLVEEVSGG